MQKQPLLADNETQQLAETVVRGMQDKKGREITSLNLKNVESAEAEYMIICHATSDVHAEAIAHSVEKEVIREMDEKPVHSEGYENKEWILLDYVTVMVHVFIEEKRSFYNLEELWGDAEIKHHDSRY